MHSEDDSCGRSGGCCSHPCSYIPAGDGCPCGVGREESQRRLLTVLASLSVRLTSTITARRYAPSGIFRGTTMSREISMS